MTRYFRKESGKKKAENKTNFQQHFFHEKDLLALLGDLTLSEWKQSCTLLFYDTTHGKELQINQPGRGDPAKTEEHKESMRNDV